MGILNWGFRANLKVHQVKDETKSIDLKTKNGGTSKFKNFIDNLEIIDPKKKLWLNPLLFNGSLQTLYYTSVDTSKKFLIYYGRELFTYEDGGICSLDWVIEPPKSELEFKKIYNDTLPEGFPRLNKRSRYFTEDELAGIRKHDQESTKPLVVVLHGLGGGSHEPLIRNLAEDIGKKTNNEWDLVVINSRGCCRTKVTTNKLFTAIATGDIKEVLLEMRRRFPNRPIYAVGFSFGAIMLANFLGEFEKDPEHDNLIKAACLIGCAWDMVDSAYHLDNSWTGKYLLNPNLTKYLNKIIKNNFKELSNHDSTIFNEKNLIRGQQQTKTWQFDNVFTCHLAGFSNPMEYYREGSPVRRIKNIKTPTLAINSIDDPAVSVRLPTFEVANNPHIALVETDLGGHLGFVQSNGDYWCVEAVEEFFTNFEAKFQ